MSAPNCNWAPKYRSGRNPTTGQRSTRHVCRPTKGAYAGLFKPTGDDMKARRQEERRLVYNRLLYQTSGGLKKRDIAKSKNFAKNGLYVSRAARKHLMEVRPS